jgi:hypothetical protein
LSEPKRSHWVRNIGATVLTMVVFVTYAAWPGCQQYTVSPQTTVFTGPLSADGKVDYITALNQKMSEGITPDRNACVDIWRALGPRPEGGNPLCDEYFEWLGVPCPPDTGDYLIDWRKFQARKPDGNAIEMGNIDPPQPPVGNPDHPDERQRWPWKTADDPNVVAWLKANEIPLAVFERASRKPEYYNPLIPNDRDAELPLLSVLLPHVQKVRVTASLLVTRAMWHLGEGRPDDAWRDLMTCHRLARLMQRGGTMIEFLVGIAMEMISTSGEHLFLSSVKWTPQDWSARLKEIQALPPGGTTVEKMNLGERTMLLDSLTDVVASGLRNFDQPQQAMNRKRSDTRMLFRRSFDWDAAYRKINEWVDRTIEAMKSEPYALRSERIRELETEFRGMKEREAGVTLGSLVGGSRTRSEQTANRMILLLIASPEKIRTEEDRLLQARRNLEVGFALAIFKAETGSYPDSLDALAPKHLSAIPTDLFNEQPLHYEKTASGYLLYSVGPNTIDDFGSTRNDQPPGDDIRLRIPVDRPKPPSALPAAGLNAQ